MKQCQLCPHFLYYDIALCDLLSMKDNAEDADDVACQWYYGRPDLCPRPEDIPDKKI